MFFTNSLYLYTKQHAMGTQRIFSFILFWLIPVYMVTGQMVSVPDVTDQENPVVSLNGTWYFCPVLNKKDISMNRPGVIWKTIEVPGEWYMQGLTVDPGAEAGYYREFDIPGDWKNCAVYLRCDAVFSASRIWVNGEYAGNHTGPMVAFEHDVTRLVKPGKTNRIVVGVVSETLADTMMSGSQYAAHPLGGILRKIYLVAVPRVHLSGLSVETRFDGAYRDAQLKITGQIINAGDASSAKISATLTGPGGNRIELADGVKSFDISGKNSTLMDLVFRIQQPEKWDAEHPKLYRLELEISSETGSEKIIEHVGFREIRVVGNQLFVNGRSVKLKGVNRHEVHPLRGRSLTAKEWETDARMFKAANVNYIRTSHYPPAEEFVEWCDRLGLYVELENPIAWIGHGANQHWQANDPHDPALYPYLEKISGANMDFFGNHCSVILWSMANESAFGPNWARLAAFYTEKDPTRPATFHDQAYGAYNNHGSSKMPVANYHYPGVRGPAIAEDFARPLLFGEYAHLNTYNRTEIVTDPGVRDAWGRGFKKMWEGMYHSRGCLGGAIWSGIDDVFYLPDGRSVGYGEWGPIDGWRREKPEYFHMKKSYTPVKIHNRHVEIPAPGTGIALQMENRFDFTNLSECKILWKLSDEEGEVKMNLAPRDFGILYIFPKKNVSDGSLLKITILSPQGMEVENEVIEIGNVKRGETGFIKPETGVLYTAENEGLLKIEGNGFIWHFDLDKGEPAGAEIDGTPVLSRGTSLMVLSLTTGECRTDHDLNIPFHNETCHNWKAKKTSWEKSGDTVVVEVQGEYTEAEGTFTWKFTHDGMLIVNFNMNSKMEINPRQIGMVFTAPRDLENLAWYRKGLWSYYPENHIGRTVGKAIPFPGGTYHPGTPGKEPQEEWRFDANSLGSNDFRATRENIFHASLTNTKKQGIVALSDGSHAFRSFVSNGQVCFLVATYSTGGGDMFFSGHYSDERKPLQLGSKFNGTVRLQLVK